MGERKSTVEDDGDIRKYFAMIPHLVNDAGLDPYAYRVYAFLVHEAGKKPFVEVSTRDIASRCAMSAPRVVVAKRHLIEAGLIAVEARGNGLSDHIVIRNIWRENFLRYSEKEQGGRSPQEHPVHIVNTPFTTGTPRSPQEHPRSYGEHPVPVVNTSPEVETDKMNEKIKEQKRMKKKEKHERNDASAPDDSFIHSSITKHPDFEVSLQLLTDPEVGLDDKKARELAGKYSFDVIERQVFAWRDDKTGEFSTLGALITRLERNFNSRPLTAMHMDSELYRRHHADYQPVLYSQTASHANRRSYRPPEYADIILGAPTPEQLAMLEGTDDAG